MNKEVVLVWTLVVGITASETTHVGGGHAQSGTMPVAQVATVERYLPHGPDGEVYRLNPWLLRTVTQTQVTSVHATGSMTTITLSS